MTNLAGRIDYVTPVFLGLTSQAVGFRMYLSLERTNQPLARQQATKRQQDNRVNAESRLSHAPNLSTDYRGMRLGAADSRDFSFHIAGLASAETLTSPYQTGQGASQMVIDNANSNPEESASIPTELWCSVCGCHLRLEVHDFRKPLNRIVINGTCLNTECPMYYQTLSPNGWMDQSVLSNYTPKAIIQFDVWTGITTQVVDQHIGNQIAWLMSRYDAKQIVAFERWINVHQHDDDFATMIAAFVEGASDAPNYDLVCNSVHMEGR